MPDDPAEERPSPVERRVQGYLPTKELRDEFETDAEERGGVSKFITYLYRRYKKGELDQSNEKQDAA